MFGLFKKKEPAFNVVLIVDDFTAETPCAVMSLNAYRELVTNQRLRKRKAPKTSAPGSAEKESNNG